MPDTPIEPTASGGYPAGMEARVAVLEQIAASTLAALEGMRNDHRASFDRIDRRFDQIDQRFETFQTKVDRRFDQIDQRFETFETKVDRQFDKVDRRFETFETKVDRRLESFGSALLQIQSDNRADFRWTLGIMISGFTGLFGLMCHGFHWFGL